MWKPGNRRFLWLWPLFLFLYNYNNFRDNQSLEITTPSFHQYVALNLNHTHLEFGEEGGSKVGRHLLYGSNFSNPSLDCIPSSIDDFPGDFFNQEQRRKGGIVIHFLLVIYLCSMLALVCDRYFVPSLEVISEYTRISPDVAGATFMAIGTSAPELFSSIIGSFITESDIGIGTIVGSAVFNILAVTGVSGIALGTRCVTLDWYPFTRDIFIYVCTIIALISIVSNSIVNWWESCVLLTLFVIYILLLCFNRQIEPFVVKQVGKLKEWWTSSKGTSSRPSEVGDTTKLLSPKLDSSSSDVSSSSSDSKNSYSKSSKYDSFGTSSCVQIYPNDHVAHLLRDEVAKSEGGCMEQGKGDAVEDQDEEEEVQQYLCTLPSGCVLRKLFWLVMWPSNFLFYVTVPDCRKKKYKKLFIATFLMSVVWLGLLSYVTFWMVTIIGYTLNIPDTVAGLTLLAAGISIPEVISSIIVVKNGQGNMALSNLVGSNVFDILFCLGVPWLVKSVFFSESKTVVINSSALTYTTITLLSTILLLFITFLVAGWQLNRKVGITCLALYVGFLVLASLYESNVFGNFNPPTCYS